MKGAPPPPKRAACKLGPVTSLREDVVGCVACVRALRWWAHRSGARDAGWVMKE
jgi:hypothetical protein